MMDRWQVAANPGTDTLVLLTEESAPEWTQVLSQAEKALDIMSVSAGQSYEVARLDSANERFLWHWDGQRLHIEVMLLWPIHAPLTLLTGHVDDIYESAEQRRPRYHEGMRFFRCSQTAGNPALAFQYLFLSLESMLAAKYPKPREQGELAWLKEALSKEEPSYLTSAREAVKGHGGISRDIEHIYQVRLALFHAKPERQPLIPLDSASEPRIREAYWRLATHVLELLRAYNVWPPGQTLATEQEVNQQGEFLQELQSSGIAIERKEGDPEFSARVMSATRSDTKMPHFTVDWDCPNGLTSALRGFTWNFGGIRPSHVLSLIPTTSVPTTLRVHLQVYGGLQHVLRC